MLIKNARDGYFKNFGYDYDELKQNNKKDLIKKIIKNSDYRANLEMYKKSLDLN